MITAIIAGLFAIGFLVVIHEAGHFFVAKAFGVGVPVFSVGVGPRIWGFWYKGTDYRLSALPFGGYVQIAGMDVFGDEPTDIYVDPDEDISRRPVWQRVAILAAGPIVNLLLPLFLFTIVLMAGEPQLGNTVGVVVPESPAAEAGVLQGDELIAVDGQPVALWVDLMEIVEGREPGPITVTFEREGGSHIDVKLPPNGIFVDEFGLNTDRLGVKPYFMAPLVGVDNPESSAFKAGIRFGDLITTVDGKEVGDWVELTALLASETHQVGFRPLSPDGTEHLDERVVTVTRARTAPWGTNWDNDYGLLPAMMFAQEVAADSAASNAGVLPGDRVLSVDGTPVRTFDHFILLTRAAGQGLGPGEEPRTIDVAVVRAGNVVHMSMRPKVIVVRGEAYARPIIGVSSHRVTWEPAERVSKYYGPVEAMRRSIRETKGVMEATAAILGNIARGKAQASENVGGPVAIFHQAGEFAEAGWFSYARFVGIISVSLGIINLLPVPVLDGGNITIYLLEAIRGRALSVEIRERIQMVGVLGLVILMLLVTVNDFSRFI